MKAFLAKNVHLGCDIWRLQLMFVDFTSVKKVTHQPVTLYNLYVTRRLSKLKQVSSILLEAKLFFRDLLEVGTWDICLISLCFCGWVIPYQHWNVIITWVKTTINPEFIWCIVHNLSYHVNFLNVSLASEYTVAEHLTKFNMRAL